MALEQKKTKEEEEGAEGKRFCWPPTTLTLVAVFVFSFQNTFVTLLNLLVYRTRQMWRLFERCAYSGAAITRVNTVSCGSFVTD